MDNFETYQLFGDDLEQASSELEIVRLSYLDFFRTSWESLFEDFDNLYAITYSSHIDFVWKVVSKFETAEIIFGNEVVIGNNLTDLISYHYQAMNQIDHLRKKVKML